MADDDKTLNIKLKFTPDQSSAGSAQKSSEKVTDTLKKTQQQAKATSDEISRLKQKAESLQRIGTMAGIAGTAILGSYTLAARNYAQYAGMAEQTSRNWLSTNRQLEQANLRLGRAAAMALTPWVEKLADVAEKIADIAEKNPELVNTVLAIGGIAAGIGTLATTVAQLLQGLAALKNLGILSLIGGAGKGIGSAGGKFAVGGLGLSSSILGGIFAGLGVNELLAGTRFGSGNPIPGTGGQFGFENFGKYFIVAMNPIYKLLDKITGWNQADERTLSLSQLLGLTKGGIEGKTTSNKSTILSEQAVKTYIAYTKATAESEKQYSKERTQIIEQTGKAIVETEKAYNQDREKAAKDFEKQQAQDLADFNQSRTRSLRDFYRSEKRTEEDYYADRAKRAADYGREVERLEADHQKNLRRMQEDHNRKVDDLLTEGDARGLEQEMYDYETERQRSEEDYQAEVAQRDEDFARETADNEEQFQQERARRIEEFNIRMQDEADDFTNRRNQAIEQYNQTMQERDEQYREELKALQEKKDEALRELDTQYSEERTKRAEAFDQQMADLGVFLNQSAEWWEAYYQWHADQLRQMMATGASGSAVGARDTGGYVWAGKWQMHNGEYVLNRATTQALENMAGGLTQDKILSMAAGKPGWGSNKGGAVYNDQRRIYARELSASDWRTMRETALDALDEIMR